MFTIWCWAIRPFPSVNGIVKTTGRVPAARAAVKVGAVQLYSSGWTVIHGYFASNSEICRFSASTASCLAPGRSTPTLIVTGAWAAADGLLPDDGAAALGNALGAGEAAGLQAAISAISPMIKPMALHRPVVLLCMTLTPLDSFPAWAMWRFHVLIPFAQLPCPGSSPTLPGLAGSRHQPVASGGNNTPSTSSTLASN